MTELSTPAALARAFTEVWTSHDMTVAGGYLAEDIISDGPLGHVEGKKTYLESLDGL